MPKKPWGIFTIFSVIITVGVYAFFYGWKYAVALVYVMVVHETGHLLAARQKRIPTSPAIFVPFLGAVIGMKEKPKNAETEAYIAYGGPFFGMLSFLPAIPLFYFTREPLWGYTVYLGAIINLFNLFPVSPLDGGRIVTVISPKIWVVGLIGLLPFLFFMPNPIFFLIFILGGFTWLGRIGETKKGELLKIQKEELLKERSDLEKLQGQLEWNRDPADKIRLMNETLYHWATRLKELERTKFLTKEDEHRGELEIQSLRYKLSRFSTYWLGNFSFEQTFREIDQFISNLDQEIFKLETYYKTSRRIKWKWITLYLGLVLLLSLILVYGINIMEMISPFSTT